MRVERFPVPMGGTPAGSVNAYLLGDDPALLLDPGGRTDALDAAVGDRAVGDVLATHTHPDHVGALAEYAATTGATVWAKAGREAEFRRATGVAPDRTFREGTALPVGDAEVFDVPGHAADHVAVAWPGGVACGDLAVAEGSVGVAAPEGDMRGYLTALRRLHARDPPALYPGHGPVVETPRATLERLIDHRRRREARVLAAVRGGARDPDAVLEAAYDKDVSAHRRLARATVVAHLEKLAVEGTLRWDPAAERVEPA